MTFSLASSCASASALVLSHVDTLLPFDLADLAFQSCEFRFAPTGWETVQSVQVAPMACAVRVPARMERAVPKRKAEFVAGRFCAMSAMRALTDEWYEVPIHEDRSPIWPAHLLGSISHREGQAAAVAGLASQWRGLGLDLEPLIDADQAERIGDMIVSEAELQLQPVGWSFPQYLTLVFSAKEAFYKAIYPFVKRILDFHEVAVCAVDDGTITLRLLHKQPAEALPDVQLPVRYVVREGVYLTLVAWRA
ncbi:4'-phosphopantetheinyl transferase family protein [Parachitinimonas caeni]|uniref:Enterobactin synthase component D n=1 Tax=Parachitinimonas caeni TaxID=3031301 RepID=A0ABT7DYY8_9NEIS|nr:4'-phosphopantetheinyl transferase superfamily protein [Parachitinimonas caeni]MDK2125261.1 4'-phosphopantetheinyl transferase superfamily protein [Parachitinimonas caeni]